MSILSAILIVIVIVLFIKYDEMSKTLKRHDEILKQMHQKYTLSNPSAWDEQNVYVSSIENKQLTTPCSLSPEPIQPKAFETKKKEKRNFENLFGKHILSFVAAALVFIGIIAFGALVLTNVTNVVKMIMIFLFSMIITVFGAFLHKKNESPFTSTVTGCGVGALFVSIFVSHLYFNTISDIVAFALVLVWAIFISILAKKLNSNVLLYISHIGCLISVLFAIGYGKIEEKVFEIFIYQLFIVCMLCVLDFKTSPRLFKGTIIGALFTNILLLGKYNSFFLTFDKHMSITQQITSSANMKWALLSIITLLTVNACIMYILGSKTYIKNNIIEQISTSILYLINLTIFASAIINELKNLFIFDVIITAFVIVTVFGVFLFINERIPRKISILTSMTYLGIVYFLTAFDMKDDALILPGFIIFAIMSIIIYSYNKEKEYLVAGCCYLIADAWFALFAFESLIILPYELLLILIAFAANYIYKKAAVTQLFLVPYFMINIILTPAIIVFIDILGGGWKTITLTTAIALTVLNIVFKLYYDKYSLTTQNVTGIIISIVMHIWLFINSVIIATVLSSSSTAQYLMAVSLSVLSLIAGMLNITKMKNSNNHILGVWYGLKLTWLTIYPMTQFTKLLDEQFIFSLACMLIATICILFGFRYKVKSIRIYGLIVVLTSVLKIVIIDVWSKESIIRVISLLIGGLICFAISAFYNQYEKRFSIEQEKDELIEIKKE